MTLFQKRGYDQVTVAEIAEEAGLTRRTFFNYFNDKREIFFRGAAAFHESVIDYLNAVPPDVPPLEAAVEALTQAGTAIGDYREYATAVRALIDTSPELNERNLAKMHSVASGLAAGLERRGTDPRTAHMAAHSAVTAYQAAWLDWGQHPERNFTDLMQQAIVDLRQAIRTPTHEHAGTGGREPLRAQACLPSA